MRKVSKNQIKCITKGVCESCICFFYILFHSWEVWKFNFYIHRAVSITLHQCNKKKTYWVKTSVQNSSFSLFFSKTISAMTYTWHFSFAILSECIIDIQHVTCTVGMDLRGFSTKIEEKQYVQVINKTELNEEHQHLYVHLY